MKHCSKCGAENSDNLTYCSLCQAPFSGTSDVEYSQNPQNEISQNNDMVDPFSGNQQIPPAGNNYANTAPSYVEAPLNNPSQGMGGPYGSSGEGLVFDQVLTSEERVWAALSHISYFIGFAFLGPLLIYFLKRNSSTFIASHAREALNFQISIGVYAFVSVFFSILLLKNTAIFFILIIIMGLAYLAAVILTIMGAIKAYNGDNFVYPMNIDFFS